MKKKIKGLADIQKRIKQRILDDEFKKIADNMPISTIDMLSGYEILEFKRSVFSASSFSLSEFAMLISCVGTDVLVRKK